MGRVCKFVKKSKRHIGLCSLCNVLSVAEIVDRLTSLHCDVSRGFFLSSHWLRGPVFAGFIIAAHAREFSE